jgi:UPF0148 protein
MAARKEDEIMAEYLLKGAKMLEKACPKCGCPFFEVKGKTYCVVCAENEQTGAKEDVSGKAAPMQAGASAAMAGKVQGHVCECGGHHEEENCDGMQLGDELAETILFLCRRIREEESPDRCLTLMNTVKAGTEALRNLCQIE